MVLDVRGKSFALIIVIVVIIIVVVTGYFLPVSLQNRLVEISKQSPDVRTFLKQYPNAKCIIGKMYLAADGRLYTVDKNWCSRELLTELEKPVDGKNHYCWLVQWRRQYWGSLVISAFIDRDSLEIALVTDTKWWLEPE